MEIAIAVSGTAASAGVIWLLKQGGVNAALEAVGIWCLVRRDKRLASKAAAAPARAKWEKAVSGE